jgi:CheY-like chemotaxis protein
MLQELLFHGEADASARVRHVLTRQACDANLTHVRNVAGFWAAMDHWRFDVILLDYALPPSEGSAVLAALTRWWPSTPAISLCPLDGECDGRTAVREGAADYLPEDQLPRLASTIRRTVARMASAV